MKINSNTIKLEKESFKQLEEVIKKIASDNKIGNVSGIQIKLSKNSGIVKFAIVDDWADEEENVSEKSDEKYSGWTNYETWNTVLWVKNDYNIYKDMILNKPFHPELAERYVKSVFPDGTPDMDSSDDFNKVNWEEVANAFNEE